MGAFPPAGDPVSGGLTGLWYFYGIVGNFRARQNAKVAPASSIRGEDFLSLTTRYHCYRPTKESGLERRSRKSETFCKGSGRSWGSWEQNGAGGQEVMESAGGNVESTPAVGGSGEQGRAWMVVCLIIKRHHPCKM